MSSCTRSSVIHAVRLVATASYTALWSAKVTFELLRPMMNGYAAPTWSIAPP